MGSTFNPIIGREGLASWNVFARPHPEPGVAVVLVRDGRPAHVLMPDDLRTTSRIRWSNYQSVYYVDVSEHALTFKCQLPSATPEHHFEAEVYAAYWVSDPRMIVQRSITDADAIVQPDLVRRMRAIAREYELEACTDLEVEIEDRIGKKQFLPEFTITRFSLTLRLEEEERTHVRRLRALTRNYEHAMRHAQYSKEIAEVDIAHARQQIGFYNELAQAGHWQFLLLHLANNQGEAQAILPGLNQQQQIDRDYWMKLYALLRDADGVEPLQLEGLRNVVLNHLAGSDVSMSSGAPKTDGVGHGTDSANGAKIVDVEPPRERAVGEG